MNLGLRRQGLATAPDGGNRSSSCHQPGRCVRTDIGDGRQDLDQRRGQIQFQIERGPEAAPQGSPCANVDEPGFATTHVGRCGVPLRAVLDVLHVRAAPEVEQFP